MNTSAVPDVKVSNFTVSQLIFEKRKIKQVTIFIPDFKVKVPIFCNKVKNLQNMKCEQL